MERTNKVFGQREIFKLGFFFHHLKAYIAGCHFLYIFDLGFTYNLAKKKQYLSLAIRQGIALYVVAVIIEVDGKSTAQQLSVSFKKRQKSVPAFHYIIYFIHISLYVCLQKYALNGI